MANFRGARSRLQSVRRKPSWNQGPAQDAASARTAAGATLWNQSAVALESGLTLVRLHGELSMWLEAVTTIGDGFLTWAFGVCIVSQNAAGVGITAIPHPLTDANWDGWWYHSLHSAIIGLSVTESDNTGPVGQVRIPFQTKSMRKIKATDEVVGVLEMGTEVGAATATFTAETRMLVLLP